MSNRNLLVICGVSGSGKSTLEKNLIEEYPELFHKWQQFSTRKMRQGERFGDPYIFVQKDTFKHMQDKLVGCLGVEENSLFKDMYGSIPDFVDGKLSTVILAEEAIRDLKQKVAEGKVELDNLFIFGLDVAYNNLKDDALREGRNEDFLDKEREVLKHADMTYKVDNGKYLSPKIIYSILELRGLV